VVADALSAAVHPWRRGGDAPQDFDEAVAVARASFADVIGVPVQQVAVAGYHRWSAWSPLPYRLVVGACRQGRVQQPYLPFAVQASRGVVVTEADLTELADRTADHDLVAVSAVASADGALADLESLAAATAGIRTKVLIEVTQAAGWLPLALDWATRWWAPPTSGCWPRAARHGWRSPTRYAPSSCRITPDGSPASTRG
jgi:hypothetical protein